jgi:hypothetical protein
MALIEEVRIRKSEETELGIRREEDYIILLLLKTQNFVGKFWNEKL